MDAIKGDAQRFPFPNLDRLAHIARVAARNGWAHYVEALQLARFLPGTAAQSTSQTDAVRLRSALEERGPTFVKFGQLLSVQRDLFPDDVISELQKLQETVPPFAGEHAIRVIQEELGAPIGQLFARLDETPFAAASIAQVHHAMMHDERLVVAKVQRPDIAKVVQQDVAILFYIARALERHVPASRRFNPVGLVEEFSETITCELAFLREAQTAERFLQELVNEPLVYVPGIAWPLTTRRVLPMEHRPRRVRDRRRARTVVAVAILLSGRR